MYRTYTLQMIEYIISRVCETFSQKRSYIGHKTSYIITDNNGIQTERIIIRKFLFI